MPVPSLITDLSTTPASNSPAGSENVFPNLDDYLRAQSAFLASVRDNSGNGWVSPYLPLAGGTMTGTVNGLQMSSANGGQLAGLRNKIINGNMNIAQRGTSFAGLGNGTSAYYLDRFSFGNISEAVFTVTQTLDAPSSNEFQYSMRVAVTTADAAIAAGQVAQIFQPIEGYNARDLIGRTFTLSFWVRAPKTGTYCVAFLNGGGDRTYVAEYTVNAVNTWEYKSVVVSGGLITAGTWNWTTGIGISVYWALAGGTTFQTTAGAWQTGNFRCTSSQTNTTLDTIGNIFAITGVQLEPGPVATPFEQRPIGMELALCQRYFYAPASPALLNIAGYTPAGGGAIYVSYSLPQVMRATPLAITSWTSLINATGSATRYPDTKTIESNIVSVAAGTESGVYNVTSATAEL